MSSSLRRREERGILGELRARALALSVRHFLNEMLQTSLSLSPSLPVGLSLVSQREVEACSGNVISEREGERFSERRLL